MDKITTNSYKKAMSKYATGITIISINDRNNYIGKTVNSFSSLSLNPPLVLFSLDKKSSSLKKFLNSSFIGISILSNKQKKISYHFSKKKPIWGKTEVFLSSKKIPLIKNAVVNLSCKNFKNIKSGDHIIFICKVFESLIQNNVKSLTYLNNKYY